jgi:hypothetical protein
MPTRASSAISSPRSRQDRLRRKKLRTLPANAIKRFGSSHSMFILRDVRCFTFRCKCLSDHDPRIAAGEGASGRFLPRRRFPHGPFIEVACQGGAGGQNYLYFPMRSWHSSVRRRGRRHWRLSGERVTRPGMFELRDHFFVPPRPSESFRLSCPGKPTFAATQRHARIT